MSSPRTDWVLARLLACLVASAGLHAGIGLVDWSGQQTLVSGTKSSAVSVMLVDTRVLDDLADSSQTVQVDDPVAPAAKHAAQPATQPSKMPSAQAASKSRPSHSVPAAADIVPEPASESLPLCMPGRDGALSEAGYSLVDFHELAAESLETVRDVEAGSAQPSAESSYASAESDSRPAAAAASETLVTRAEPKYSLNPEPVYPRQARRRHWQGTVWLQASVTDTGVVSSLEVAESSGYRILDDSALETVKQWQFVPARSGGLPVACDVRIPIRFQLEQF